MTSSAARKIAAICTVLGLATVGTAAAPKPANAWWYRYGCCWGVGVYVPPVVVAPPPPHRPTTRRPPITPRLPAPGSRRIGRAATGFPAIGHKPVKQFIRATRLSAAEWP